MLNALKIASERDIKIRILLDDEDPINNMLLDLANITARLLKPRSRYSLTSQQDCSNQDLDIGNR